MGPQGRKAKSKHSKSHTSFTTDDVWEMIAYLDYCVMFNPDHQRFRDTITAHLKAYTSKTFTPEQVGRKIQRLWAVEGIEGADQCDYHSIYHHGSKVLRCVQEDLELKAKIQARTMEIKDLMAAECIYSYARTTRSKGSKHQHIKLGDDVDEPTRRTPRKTAADAPSKTLTDQEHLRYNSLEASARVSASFSQSSEGFHSFRNSATLLENHNHLLLETKTMRGESSLSEPTDTSASTVSISTVKQEILRPQSTADSVDSRSELSLTPGACIERWQYSKGVPDASSQIEKLRKENLWYRQEVKRLSEVNADLDRKRRASQAAQSILSKDAHTSEQRLAECLSEIYNLESQVNNKEVLLPFTKPGGKRLDGLERSEIVTDLNLIERHLSSVLVLPETKSIRTDFDLHDQQSDLPALSRRIFGGSMMVPPHAQFRHIFRSLVSAAVGMWVFESDFDDPYVASSNLREVMLSHLRTQDGEDVARNLDFAAHHTLINNEYFQREIIPMRAAELAKRLRLALDPVLKAEKAYSGWRTDISSLWKPRLAALKYIFEVALRIKTKVLVTQDMFEIVLPAHGDSYDERLMQVENGLPANKFSRVRLAVAPGLQRFEYNRKMVDYNSFRLPVPMPNPGFDVMKRAMVVLD